MKRLHKYISSTCCELERAWGQGEEQAHNPPSGRLTSFRAQSPGLSLDYLVQLEGQGTKWEGKRGGTMSRTGQEALTEGEALRHCGVCGVGGSRSEAQHE